MLRGDIAGNLSEHLENHAGEIDLLIWDLMVERLGVRMIRTGGLVTRNASLKRMIKPSNLSRAIAFGSDEHFRLWCSSLRKLIRTLDGLELKDKVVVNATPWAERTISGDTLNIPSAMTPEWFNRNIQRYWTTLYEAGIRVARVAQSDAIADPNHKWGPAHYHYAPSTYKAALNAIDALL